MPRATDFNFGNNLPNARAAAESSGSVADELTSCMGSLVCPKCGRFHGYCSEVNFQLTGTTEGPQLRNGENEMDLGQFRDKSKGSGGGKYKRRPFLKAKDIPTKGGLTAKVLDFRQAPKQMEYSDFLCDIAAGSKEFTVGLRSESVLFDMLIDELGTKSEKWIGKKVKFVRGGPKGQYINVG